MICKNCGENYPWENGEALMLNGEELDFCSKGCIQDFKSENDLIEIVPAALSRKSYDPTIKHSTTQRDSATQEKK